MWGKKKQIIQNMLIFLDIDGVLNTSNSFNTKYEILEENVFALKQLVNEFAKQGYSSKIILTSTWRLGYDSDYEKCSPQIQRLITKLKNVNIQLYGATPVYKGKTRDIEIVRYLRGYELREEKFDYIILDDDISVYDGNALKELKFYKVNQHTGFTVKDVERIVKGR